jgi:hypothetical protein
MNAKLTAARLASEQMKAIPEERYDRWRVYMNYLKAIEQGTMLDQEKQHRQKVAPKVDQLADYWLP